MRFLIVSVSASALLVLGGLFGPQASADPPGMTHDCASCMTHD